MNDTKSPVIQTVRVPREVDTFAAQAALVESASSGRKVTKADILRDLMREGMTARKRPQPQPEEKQS